MVDIISSSFNGFSPRTLEFLKNLEANNNKIWFEANRDNYLNYLYQPLLNLASALAPYMLTVDPYLETRPGKTLSRIHRDTRFSRDKSPYKNNMWITFKRTSKDWQEAPAYFFEITQDSYRYGMGFYNAGRQTMDKFREAVEYQTKTFLDTISFYTNESIFTLEGEKYKKILKPELPEKVQDWYQRKNFYLVCNRGIETNLFSEGLVDDLICGFALVAPFYHYLWRIKTT